MRKIIFHALSVLLITSCASCSVKMTKAPKLDEHGCIIKREGLRYEDIEYDESLDKYFTPDGEEITEVEALAHLPQVVELCKKNQ